jgi:hypothetical protein
MGKVIYDVSMSLDGFIAGATDSRWDDEDLNQLKTVPGDAFEVVITEEIVYGD